MSVELGKERYKILEKYKDNKLKSLNSIKDLRTICGYFVSLTNQTYFILSIPKNNSIKKSV